MREGIRWRLMTAWIVSFLVVALGVMPWLAGRI